MLKRCQVLLEDWQVEHLKLISQKNDLSFSEMIRVVLSEGLLHTCPYIYPGLKSKTMSEKDIAEFAIEGSSPKTTQERKHKLTSNLYFEAHKAAELMNEEIKKEMKKS